MAARMESMIFILIEVWWILANFSERIFVTIGENIKVQVDVSVFILFYVRDAQDRVRRIGTSTWTLISWCQHKRASIEFLWS